VIMRDHEDEPVIGSSEIGEQLDDLSARLGIEHSRRLVGEDDRGATRQGSSQSDALLFTAAQIAGQKVQAIAQADAGEQFGRLTPRRRARDSLEPQRKLDVLHRGERREEIERLKHEADVVSSQKRERPLVEGRDFMLEEKEASTRRFQQASHKQEERRLAAARRSHQEDESSSVQFQTHVVYGDNGRRPFSVYLADTIQSENGSTHMPFSFGTRARDRAS